MILTLLSLLLTAVLQGPAPSLRAEDVTFQNAGVTLAGTVILPSATGRRPAIALLGGSGPGPRAALMPYASHLASLGVVALAFDKRGSGQSGGDWTEASLEDLADDAAAAMKYLASRPDVDPARVGLWGVSQAGWVIPLLAQRTPPPAFSIIVTGGGATPREIEMYGYQRALDDGQVSGADRAKAEALLGHYFSWLGSGQGRPALVAEIDRVKNESWYRFVSVGGILPSEASRPKWAWVANFDPAASIASMWTPTLVVLGSGDPLGPADLSAERWRNSLAKSGNPDARVLVFDDMGHAARQGQGHNASNPLSPSYLSAVESFIKTYAYQR